MPPPQSEFIRLLAKITKVIPGRGYRLQRELFKEFSSRKVKLEILKVTKVELRLKLHES
jgi:hypothetical protein